MIQLKDENNFGCQLRDGIYKNIDKFKVNGTVHLSLIRKAFDRITIPDEYKSDILLMVNFRKYERTTDYIEQLIEGVIIRQIIEKIINEENNGCLKNK